MGAFLPDLVSLCWCALPRSFSSLRPTGCESALDRGTLARLADIHRSEPARIADAAGASKLADAAGFVIVGVGAVFLTMQVPTLVNSLSGTITATANGMAMTMGAAGMGAASVAAASAAANAFKNHVAAPYLSERHAVAQAGRDATASGGNAVEARYQERQRQKEIRQKYARKSAAFAATHGTHASAADRFANAGQRLENRNARQDRAARLAPAGATSSRKRKAD